MGQVPKNNIIKAQLGATLSLKVDGVLKQISVEKADEMAALEADRLIEAGELRPSEKVAYMSSWNKLKDKTTQGEFSIDTAGKSTVSSVGYTGDVSSFGTTTNKEGEIVAAEGSNLRNKFTKKIKRGNLAQMEATVARTMFPKIGQLSLEGDEELAIKAKSDEEALKLKTAAETSKLKAAEETRWASTSPDQYLSKQFGGTSDYRKAYMNLPIAERASMLKGHAEDIISNRLKYKPLEGQSFDWLEKHKDPSGNLVYDEKLYKELYPRIQGGAGLDFINEVYNTIPEGTLTTEEKEEESKKEAVRARDKELEHRSLLLNKDIKKVAENTYDEIEPSLSLSTDKSRRFTKRRIWNPVKRSFTDSIVEALSNTRPGTGVPGIATNVVYELYTDPNDKKQFFVNKNNPKDMLPVSDLSSLELSSFKNLQLHKDGGILKYQVGGEIFTDFGVSKKKKEEPKSEKSTTKPPIKNIKNKDTETKLSEIGDWSTSDELELASLVADVGGLAASFIPGGSVVSGVSGLTGTGLAMAAEKSRGELGWEDTGKYALSGLLDLASVVPGIGVAAKVGKLNKTAEVAAKLIFKASKAGLLVGGGAMTGSALLDIGKKLKEEGFKSLTVQDLKTLTQGLTLMGHAAKSVAAPRAKMLKGFEGTTTMGKAIDKTTGEAINAPLIKDKNNNWVFEDSALAKTHETGKTNPFMRKSEIMGTESKVISSPIMTKSEYNPTTGKQRGVMERNFTPLYGMTNKYIKKAGRLQTPEATFKSGGKILKGRSGLNSSWYKEGQNNLQNKIPGINAEVPLITNKVKIPFASSYGTGKILLANQPAYNPTGNLLSKTPLNSITNLVFESKTIKPLSGRIKSSELNTKTLSGLSKFHPTGSAKDEPLNIKLNEKQGLDLSEFGRTMYLNKGLGEKVNPLYVPTVTDKMETRISVGGDLLSKQNQYNRASQLMNSSINTKSSDPIRNFIQNLATNAQAEQIRNQADLEYAQGLERSKGIQAQLMDQAAGERKQAADQRSMYFTKARAAKNEADWATKVGQADNLNTYWASRNLEHKYNLAQKEGVLKAFNLQQRQAEIEFKYPGIVQKYLQSGPNGGVNLAFKDQYDKYSKELADAQKQVYFNKDGGKAKYEMEMYKDQYRSKKDIANALNRWQSKQSDRTFQNTSKSSKELTDLVSKIFTK